MRNLKTKLFAATIMTSIASPAFAQFAFPTVELDGVGASAPADINVKVQKCIGVDVDLAVNNSATLEVIPAANYTPSTPTAANPELNCSAGDDIYNAGTTTYTGKYVATGSGFGRRSWRNFANNFTGAATNQNAHAPFTDPPGTGTTGAWTNVQYALSETPIGPNDIIDYNTDNGGGFSTSSDPVVLTVNGVANVDADDSALAAAGPAIQIPLYVVPIAVAYAPRYGTNASGQPMNFNVKTPVVVNGVIAGGLRLNKLDYCGIFNGTITNWNAPALKTRNGNQDLFDPITDSSSRWLAVGGGAPIRIVGRADNSGSTNVFTRALAAQCGLSYEGNGTSFGSNRFDHAADALPYGYDTASGGTFTNPTTIDITGLQSASAYKPSNVGSATLFAGKFNSIGGVVYDGATFCDSTAASAGTCGSILANPGSGTIGKFILADTSIDVEAAVADADNDALLQVGAVKINGKAGYIAGDFVVPTAGRTLHTAALQVGTGAAFAIASAAQANTAFGAVFPPQSTAASGVYNTADARVVYKDLANTAQPSDTPAQIAAKVETVTRTNPIHWVNILYPAPFDVNGNPATQARTLANPTTGYPITGTSNLLTYTCFSSSGKKHGIANVIQYITGKVVKKNAAGGNPSSISLSANTFPGTAPANFGILTKSNTATVPAGWRTAIVETFLKKSTQNSGGTLGSLNLWLQTAQPTTATGTAATSLTVVDEGAGGGAADNRNPKCVAGGVADNASASLPGA